MKNAVLILGLFFGAASAATAQESRPSRPAAPAMFSAARHEAAKDTYRRVEPAARRRTTCGEVSRAPRDCGGLDLSLVNDFSLVVFHPKLLFGRREASYAQADIQTSSAPGARFGIKAGVNFSDVAGAESDKNIKGLTGLNAGLMADLPFSDRLSFHPELLFSQKGAKSTQADPSGASFTERERVSYLDLPLLLRLKANGFFLEAGPQLSYLVAQKSDFTEYAPSMGTYSYSSTDTDGTRRLDLGYVAGVGYQLPQGLEVGVRYNGGISDLSDPSASPTLRNSVFQLQVGYLFGGK